jgi:hypothetical protein
MGCNFDYYNETKDEKYSWTKFDNYKFYRNLNRITKDEFINIIKEVIKFKNWDTTDIIYMECCCDKFKYENDDLTHTMTDNFWDKP